MERLVLVRMAGNYIDALLDKYSKNLLKSVETLECRGRFRMFFPNFFTFVQVHDDFANIATEILSSSGFRQGSLMEKRNTPRTHISIMNKREQRRVSKMKAYEVQNKWRGSKVTFQIEKVQMWWHYCQGEEKKLVCCFKINSAMIDAIREDLGLDPYSFDYNMHMSISEKYI